MYLLSLWCVCFWDSQQHLTSGISQRIYGRGTCGKPLEGNEEILCGSTGIEKSAV